VHGGAGFAVWRPPRQHGQWLGSASRTDARTNVRTARFQQFSHSDDHGNEGEGSGGGYSSGGDSSGSTLAAWRARGRLPPPPCPSPPWWARASAGLRRPLEAWCCSSGFRALGGVGAGWGIGVSAGGGGRGLGVGAREGSPRLALRAWFPAASERFALLPFSRLVVFVCRALIALTRPVNSLMQLEHTSEYLSAGSSALSFAFLSRLWPLFQF
jgi:hypothetical protein